MNAPTALFSAEARRALVKILGSAEAAARIEADSLEFRVVYDIGAIEGYSPSELRDHAAKVASVSAALLSHLEAKDELNLRALWLCNGPAYLHERRKYKAIAEWGVRDAELAWADLLNHLRALAARAEEFRKMEASQIKPGRKPQLGVKHLVLCLFNSLVEREGIKASTSSRSRMVRTFTVVFTALGIALDPREQVRAIVEERKRLTGV